MRYIKFRSKFTFFLILLFLFFIFLSIISRPLILSFAKNNLSKIFKESDILIGSFNIKLFRSISFFDVEIKNPKYNFKIKEVGFLYNLPSIINRRFKKVYLKDIFININSFNLDFFDNFKTKSSFNKPFIDSFSLSNVNLNIKTKDFSILGYISLEFDSLNKLINLLKIDIKNLKINNLLIYRLFADIRNSSGRFLIKQINFNDIKIKDIKSDLSIKQNNLFSNLEFSIAEGIGLGILNVDFYKRLIELNLNFLNLDAEKFIRDFKFEKNLFMTGNWEGDLKIIIENLDLKDFNGNFRVISKEGILTINNKDFLENFSKTTNLTSEILMERFKDYKYNIGNIELFLKGKDLVCRVFFVGDKGKSDFIVNIYNFKDMFLYFLKLTGGAK